MSGLPPLMIPIPPPDEAHRRRPKWPTTVGVNSILISVLSMTGGLIYFFVVVHGNSFFLMGLSVLDLFLNVILLAGGILLLQRKPVAVRLHKIWATINLVGVVILFFLTAVLLLEYHQHQHSPWERPEVSIDDLVLTGLHAIYPIFLLIWMTRRFVRRDLAKW